MAKSNQRICIDVKTIIIDDKKTISFRCFSDGDIEKYDYVVPEWVAIGNGNGAEQPIGECVGFSIHLFKDNQRYLAVRWFKSGLVQQAHPGGVWFSVKKVKK